MEVSRSSYFSALEDFNKLQRRAAMARLWRGVTGKSDELLSYEDVSRRLKITGRSSSGIQNIPLDAIVGSVGRYNDFTRDFLPRHTSSQERWARVRASADEMVGWPPIEVYKVGDAYFVLDGNHRVSVARKLGARTIQADVTEVFTRVPLSPNDTPDDIIAKAEYAQFLEETRLDDLVANPDLKVTVAGGYPELLDHIAVHRYFMGLEEEREVSFSQAAGHWYETVYLPIVDLIRSTGLLRRFSKRTEADLYLWIGRNRAELATELGLEVTPENVVIGMASGDPESAKTGTWREVQVSTRRDDTRIDILVPVSGEEIGWNALDQALVVAEHEPARLHGLHVVPKPDPDDLEDAEVVKAEFEARCRAAGVDGKLVVATGDVAWQVRRRARWTDLIVANLAHPPASGALEKLRPGFRSLLRQAAWPVLITPSHTSMLARPLLAFDGSQTSIQALYLITYFAGRWKLPITVVTVTEKGGVHKEIQRLPKDYFHSRGIPRDDVTFVQEVGPVGPAILRALEVHECDIVFMGSFSRRGISDMVADSALDYVLRNSWWPMLVCR